MSKKTFHFDGPMMQSYETMRNLLFINLLTVICAIPIVTAGASFAAMHTVILKMARNEEGYVSKDFFRAFRQNLKIGVKASVALLLLLGFILADFYAISLLDVWFADAAKVLLYVICLLTLMTVSFLFPVMAKFDANLRNTVKNAFCFAASHIGKAILLLILHLLPWVICYFVNVLIPLLFFFGFSAPAMIGVGLYEKEFKKMEDAFYEKQHL